MVCSSFARRCVVSGMSTFIVGQALSTFMTPRTFPNDIQRRAESGYKSGVLSVHGSLTAALLLFACGGGAMERTDFVKVQSGDARSGDPFSLIKFSTFLSHSNTKPHISRSGSPTQTCLLIPPTLPKIRLSTRHHPKTSSQHLTTSSQNAGMYDPNSSPLAATATTDLE